MKKLFTFIALGVLFMTTASNLIAQNRCVIKNSKGSQEFATSSKNVKVLEQNDQFYHVVAYPDIKPQAKGNAPTHTLNVYPPMEYELDIIWVSDGFDIVGIFFEGMGDYLRSCLKMNQKVFYVDQKKYINN